MSTHLLGWVSMPGARKSHRPREVILVGGERVVTFCGLRADARVIHQAPAAQPHCQSCERLTSVWSAS